MPQKPRESAKQIPKNYNFLLMSATFREFNELSARSNFDLHLSFVNTFETVAL